MHYGTDLKIRGMDMTFGELRNLIKIDMDRNQDLSKNCCFIWILRVGQWGHANHGRNMAACAAYYLCRVLMRLTVNKYNHYSYNTVIGGGIRVPHNMGIVVSGKASIGECCTIFHQVTIGVDETNDPDAAPVIGNNVVIGAGAKIVGRVKIGNHVKIGANAVVTKDVPDGVTVVGNNRIISN